MSNKERNTYSRKGKRNYAESNSEILSASNYNMNNNDFPDNSYSDKTKMLNIARKEIGKQQIDSEIVEEQPIVSQAQLRNNPISRENKKIPMLINEIDYNPNFNSFKDRMNVITETIGNSIKTYDRQPQNNIREMKINFDNILDLINMNKNYSEVEINKIRKLSENITKENEIKKNIINSKIREINKFFQKIEKFEESVELKFYTVSQSIDKISSDFKKLSNISDINIELLKQIENVRNELSAKNQDKENQNKEVKLNIQPEIYENKKMKELEDEVKLINNEILIKSEQILNINHRFDDIKNYIENTIKLIQKSKQEYSEKYPVSPSKDKHDEQVTNLSGINIEENDTIKQLIKVMSNLDKQINEQKITTNEFISKYRGYLESKMNKAMTNQNSLLNKIRNKDELLKNSILTNDPISEKLLYIIKLEVDEKINSKLENYQIPETFLKVFASEKIETVFVKLENAINNINEQVKAMGSKLQGYNESSAINYDYLVKENDKLKLEFEQVKNEISHKFEEIENPQKGFVPIKVDKNSDKLINENIVNNLNQKFSDNFENIKSEIDELNAKIDSSIQKIVGLVQIKINNIREDIDLIRISIKRQKDEILKLLNINPQKLEEVRENEKFDFDKHNKNFQGNLIIK